MIGYGNKERKSYSYSSGMSFTVQLDHIFLYLATSFNVLDACVRKSI
jgi:hypothetical protein